MKRIIFLLILQIPANIFCQETDINQITYNNKTYPLYPKTIVELPAVSSPFISADGVEVLISFTKDENYLLFPVTMENGDPLNYKQYKYGKGLQCTVDASDFPTLAKTGLHDEAELDQTKTITGKTIIEITKDGRPMQYSGVGFMSSNEDIISVLKYDNLLAKKMELSHPDFARPLFHVWNIVLQGIKRDVWLYEQMQIDYILYNGRKVFINWQGGRGWQESLFNDEILGQHHLEMWRELDKSEKDFLLKSYADLTEREMTDLVKKLSYIHCGEMAPYYIMRYGFYEGHIDYRADPIAIAYIFGLKSIEEINMALKGDLYTALTLHHSSNRK